MRRLSVIATLRDAYGFVFTHLGGIIGLIWLPMVLITVAQFFAFTRYYNGFIDAAIASNPALLSVSLLTMLGYLVAALLLYAIMVVAVVQLATGARDDSALVYFGFGPLEWRAFRGFLGLAGLGMVIVFATLTLVEGLHLTPMMGGGFLMLVMGAAGLFAAPRLVLLLPAIAVTETAPVLRRAWALSQGHHLRLLGILSGIVLPPFALVVIAEAWLGAQGPVLSGPASLTDQVAFATHAREILPLTCGLGFFIAPLVVGVFAGASVSAWRALKDSARVEIVA